MKTIIGCLSIVITLAANAVSEEAINKRGTTTAERVAKMGGYVVRPGSMQGSIVFIDTQKKAVIGNAYTNVIESFNQVLPIKIDLTQKAPDDPGKLKKESKADFAVILVDDENSPSMTIYPEDDYAVVNFAKYTKCLKFPDDKSVYEKRCAKGMLKALILLTNGGGSTYQGHIAMTRRPEQLDLTPDSIPCDIQEAMKSYLASAGVTPMRRTVYRKACQEGWAPAPTNDVQKAIWDKVHSIPDKPMKIEFDPAAQKGKVTK